MEQFATFKIPILLRRKGVDECLNGRVRDRLRSSLAFGSGDDRQEVRNWHEISPRLNMSLNPGYRMETWIARSEMKGKFPNHFRNSQECSPDRFFFKKKDEMVTYTESFFKNKILYSKK